MGLPLNKLKDYQVTKQPVIDWMVFNKQRMNQEFSIGLNFFQLLINDGHLRFQIRRKILSCIKVSSIIKKKIDSEVHLCLCH